MIKQMSFVLLAIALIVVLPMVRADMPDPYSHPLEITNIITNIQDFQDYVFFSVGGFGEDRVNPNTFFVIGDDGIIPGYYKFLTVSVYAVKKSNFEEFNKTITPMIAEDNETLAFQEFNDYINSSSAKVIDNVDNWENVPNSDTRESITNEYTIDPEIIKKVPDKVIIEKSALIYVYIIVPIVALLIIVLILTRRRND